jgi:putative methyltransferase (TIGR04325 family)
MTLRAALRDLTPPLLQRAVRRARRSGLRFEGNYASWPEAQRASQGYDGEQIAHRVLEAELKVKRGEAADARDGVTFDAVQFSLPVMAALARAANERGDDLRVLDIGGAFGNLYRHFRAFGLRTGVSWTVIEQPAYMKPGVEHFQDGRLRFGTSLEEELAVAPADVVLLSSVLQYLEEPHTLVRRVAAWGPGQVVVDRTPCSALERDVLTVQKVPEEIYRASYPCWILSRRRLLDAFGPRYRLLASFADASGTWHAGGTEFELAGFLLDRIA